MNNCIILNIIDFNMPKGDENTISHPVQESANENKSNNSQDFVHVRLILKTPMYDHSLFPAAEGGRRWVKSLLYLAHFFPFSLLVAVG